MRILLASSAYNSLTQRVHAELADRGHEVAVELALGDEVLRQAVRRHDPALVIAPMLTTAIPADIWWARPCFIVHPGLRGDRGPSSLDWAIMNGARRWGVTVLQANAQMDAGDIWASVEFPVPACSKSSLYRTEVADAALEAVLLAVARFAAGGYRPEPLDYSRPDVTGRCRPPCRQADRRIDWPTEPTSTVVAKLRAADSSPGVLDVIGDREYFLFGGYEDDQLRGEPGSVIAQRDGAICRATVDGAVWIPQLRRRPAPGGPATCKLPATLALCGSLAGVPQIPAPLARPSGGRTYQEISYRESGGVGYLEFSFPGGAMSTGQCRRLLAAYRHAQARPVKVIVLGGARDLFSNGIHLNVIEAAEDPAAESWRNINAIDDLVEAILTTAGKLTVAAIAGNAAAGGLMLALAADQVWCRAGAVLNSHYRLMGLHGSEYWTYTLPRRVGAEHAARLTEACLPVTPASALRYGLVDRVITAGITDYHTQVATLAAQLAHSPDYSARLGAKAEELAAAQEQRPLAAYRAAELAIMTRNFFGLGEPYPQLRRAFVYKDKPTRTPPHLTRHPARSRHDDPRSPGAAETFDIPGRQPVPHPSADAALPSAGSAAGLGQLADTGVPGTVTMPAHLTEDGVEGQATFLDCPAYLGTDGAARCGLPAEVEARYSIGSTDGPLESARIRCPQGHWFNGPIESLAMPQQPARARASASPSPHLTIPDRSAQVAGP